MILRLAQTAEELGYTQFGVAEGWTHDAFVLLGQVAAATSTIELGTGVVSVWSRTPAALAMGAATIQRTSGRRFFLGLGVSSASLVEGLHGVPWRRPQARLRQTVAAVRTLLEGGRTPLEYDGVRPLRLGLLPERPVSITLAALAPKSVRLAGEVADRWLPFLWPRSRVDDGRALIAEGEAAGERTTPTAITLTVPTALAEHEADARTLAAGWLVAYLTRMGPLYPRILRDQFGFGREIDALLEVNDGTGTPRLPPAAERMARELTLMGTYDEGPELARSWLDTEVDGINLVMPPGVPEPVLEEIVGATAPAAAEASLPGRERVAPLHA